MEDNDFERLVGCFKRVFKNLKPADIPAATHESIGAWDSMAHITLLNLIREEFNVDIDFDEFDSATSFAAILDLIRARTVNAQP
jgi:acyl carrier protein